MVGGVRPEAARSVTLVDNRALRLRGGSYLYARNRNLMSSVPNTFPAAALYIAESNPQTRRGITRAARPLWMPKARARSRRGRVEGVRRQSGSTGRGSPRVGGAGPGKSAPLLPARYFAGADGGRRRIRPLVTPARTLFPRSVAGRSFAALSGGPHLPLQCRTSAR